MKHLIISYKSRNNVMNFAKILRSNGVICSIINTPHSIYSGCSLSIKTEYRYIGIVSNLINQNNKSDLIGVFSTFSNFNYGQIERLI